MGSEMMSLPQDEFEALKACLPRTTAEGLYDTYRISQATWYKLRDGVPVRRGTVERVRARYREVAGR